jgi:glycosyltransferase involved in cell wall biosynthesis
MTQTDGNGRLLTVGIPVHNAMPYLRASLESILGQSYEDFSILVIVDGTHLDGVNDGSLEYLHTIRDARLRIVEQQHCGLTFTLNRMLRECETPWLVRQDADDISTPERLEKIVDGIRLHPDAGMFYSNAAYYPPGKSFGLYRCTRGTPDEVRAVTRSGYVPAICHPSVTLNVQKTLAVGAYRPGIQCEDADLWWRMALAFDIRFLPEILLLFRQNPNSLTSRNLRQQEVHGLYVQYLLLSQLQSRTPEKLVDVESELLQMIDESRLSAKKKLRSFNMHMAENRRIRALQALAASVLASPRYFIERLRDELFPRRLIANGIAPRYFRRRSTALWPQDSQV